MRLHTNEDIASGHVVVSQRGGILLCLIKDLIYEPGDDADADMIVNPTDIDMVRATWFEPRGSVQ